MACTIAFVASVHVVYTEFENTTHVLTITHAYLCSFSVLLQQGIAMYLTLKTMLHIALINIQ